MQESSDQVKPNDMVRQRISLKPAVYDDKSLSLQDAEMQEGCTCELPALTRAEPCTVGRYPTCVQSSSIAIPLSGSSTGVFAYEA